eukprot:TRINITY_DN26776_c0_g1_i1.p1 TRINITY_DN26776_c0_g1~~TRINITY_DN26776_c0_g1_i1.p1  ORF type:complete len:267 (+),score=52.68 TRINITY_DN26776_c0_g1_i1:30-830(+)
MEVEQQNPRSMEIEGEETRRSAKEGRLLLGSATFTELPNGRLKCVETGHELPSKELQSYGNSKACRLALIDLALSLKKPPLNSFTQHPTSKSKLICKLTGDTINKSEEHIWKHISGKRFQNILEQKEAEKVTSLETAEKDDMPSQKLSKSNIKRVKKDLKSEVCRDDSEGRLTTETNSDLEEPDFWTPPVGSRWDFDDGKDRWESCMSSDHETEEGMEIDGADEQDGKSEDVSVREKQRPTAVGPSNLAPRKKKLKGNKKSKSIRN